MTRTSMTNARALIIHLLKSVKFLILSSSVIGIFWAIDNSLRPYILKIIIDRAQNLNPVDAVAGLFWPLAIYLCVSLFMITMFRVRDYIYLTINANLKIIISHTLMDRMLQHSMILFQNSFAGNLAARIKDVMSGMPDAIKGIDELVAIFLCLVIATLTLATINYQFAILLITWLIIFAVITFNFTKRAKELCISAAELSSILMGQLVDILSNVSSIKLFARKNYELTHLHVAVLNKVNSDKRRDWYFLKAFAVLGITFLIYQAACFTLLIYWFKNGRVTPGDFALLIAININIVGELWTLSGRILSLSEILGNISQGLRVAFKPIDILDKPKALPLNVTAGSITFEDITFSYPSVNPIFTSKSITIKAGEKVGLVGYSGSGKTTFVNLILRLYDINSGRILIDNQNIKDVTQASLHENISFIPQDASLFHRTLMDNIRYGKINATDEEVILASKKANADGFINNLPEQYNAMVGERGVKLSGGQRQRIAIARAILKNAPILILDEATSQLDSVTESYIQESILDLMQNKTTIIIAHRLATLLKMDRILVFADGKIVEDGTHIELIAANGMYKKLWDAQVGGMLLDEAAKNE